MKNSLAIATAFLFFLVHSTLAADDRTSVTIDVQAEFGGPLPNAHARLVEIGTRKEVGSFQHLVAAGIPYGEYILLVTLPGFRNHEQHLKVYQPRVSVRVGLLVSNSDTGINRVAGTIHPGGPDLWVKLVPLLNEDSLMEDHATLDGRFEITGVDAGDYLLVVVKSRRVVHTRQVSIGGTQEIQIELPDH